MKEYSPDAAVSSLLRLLSRPLIIKITDALGNRKYTLPGLAKKVDRSKSQVCMALGELHEHGYVDKNMEAGKMRYRLSEKGVKYIYRKALETVEAHSGEGE